MRHLEEGEQTAVVQWAAYVKVRLDDGALVPLSELTIAIPNGAHLAGDERARAMQMSRLKRLGLRPGAADLLITLARGAWHGLWIEMKKSRKDFRKGEAARAVSADQRAFKLLQHRAGYRCVACYGFEEARDAILTYLEERDAVLTEGT